MRYLPLALALVAACQPRAAANAPLTDADRAAVTDSLRAIGARMFALLNARDVEGLKSLYTSGEFISSENGMVYPSRAAMDSGAGRLWGMVKTATFTEESQRIDVLDRDNAVVASVWRMSAVDTADRPLERRGAWVGTFHRGESGWRIVAESNSTPAGMR